MRLLDGVPRAMVGSLIVASLLYLISCYRQEDSIRRYARTKRAQQEDKRLLWVIRELSHDDLNAAIHVQEAADRAEVQEPALERLQRQGLIVPFGRSNYFKITMDGLRAAPPPIECPSFWELLFGG